jgi:hypothetical protein
LKIVTSAQDRVVQAEFELTGIRLVASDELFKLLTEFLQMQRTALERPLAELQRATAAHEVMQMDDSEVGSDLSMHDFLDRIVRKMREELREP